MISAGLLLAAAFVAPFANAETLVFQGRVEAAERAELSSRIDGVVAEILFSGGEAVASGQAMIRLDPSDAELNLAMAKARLDEARARLSGAERAAQRQEELFARGIASEAVVGPVRTTRAAAQAAVALAEAEQARAKLDVERTLIRAPISGYAGRPLTSTGAFLEAESGAPLGEILALDPVILAYRVPYATRLATLADSGAATLDALFARISLDVELPGGVAYPHSARPDYASATVDPQDGTVTVRAPIANPNAILRPGMDITVRVTIAEPETD